MAHSIILATEAVRDLRRLSAADRALVRRGLDTYLRHEPTKISRSRIKRLRGLSHPQYRLRIDDIRVFCDVINETVEILAIVTKPEADIWLAQFGEPL